MSRLLLWSGGADSTYALVKLLREGDSSLRVLHCLYDNTVAPDSSDRRRYASLSLKAVHKIKAMLEDEGLRFELLFASIKYGWESDERNRYSQALYHAGVFCRTDREVTEVWIGRGQHDLDDELNLLEGIDWRERTQLMRDTLRCGLHTPSRNVELKYFLPTRAEELAYIGRELWDASWSCLAPTLAGAVCGSCKPCSERGAVE